MRKILLSLLFLAVSVSFAKPGHPFNSANSITAKSSRPVVILDESLEDVQIIQKAINKESIIILFNKNESAGDIAAKLIKATKAEFKISSLSIISHGKEGAFYFGKDEINASNTNQYFQVWYSIASVLEKNASVNLYSCLSGKGSSGRKLVSSLSKYLFANVNASEDLTGAGGNWDLEVKSSSGNPTEVLNKELLKVYNHSLQTVLPGYTFSTYKSGLTTAPAGITINNSTLDIFYGDYGNNFLRKVDAAKNFSTVTDLGFYPYAGTELEYYNGKVYLVTTENGFDYNLYEINTSTGAKTILYNFYSTLTCEGGIAISSSGKIYLTDGGGACANGADQIWEYDLNTGSAALKLAGIPPVARNIEYNPSTGGLYFSSSPTDFYSADIINQTINPVSTDPSGEGHFAIDPNGLYIYTRVNTAINRIDIATGISTPFITGLADNSSQDLVFGNSSSGCGISLYFGNDTTIAEVSGFSPSIQTGNLNINYCASSSLNVPFSVLSSKFCAGNVFTAELSDANGNFASPQNIGTLTGITSGTINASIPANTLVGNRYRIRVVASNPVSVGRDNGVNLTINPAIASVSVTNGLMVYFPFNGNVSDSSGNNNNASIIGGVTPTTDRLGNAGKAMLFNGTDGYLTVPSSASLQSPQNKLTITTWIYANSFNSNNLPICRKSNSAAQRGQYGFSMRGNLGGYSRLSMTSDNDVPYNYLRTGQWVHVTMIYDSANVSLYINGIYSGQFASSTTMVADGMPLEIGRDLFAGTGFLNGKLDEFRIYNRVLNQAEIWSVFNNGTLASSNSPVCQSSPLQISSVNIPGATYSWTGSNSYSSSQRNNSVNGVPAGPASYSVIIHADGCDFPAQTINASILAPPPANTGTDTSMCIGETTLLGSAAIAGNVYSWSPATGLSSAATSNPSANPTATTTYTLTETISSVGCSKSNSVVVTINPLPQANAGLNEIICSGENTLIGNTAVAGNSYSWSPVTNLSSGIISNPSANPTASITYTLTEVILSTGCSKSDSVTVTVNPLPLADAGSDKNICAGQNVTIGAANVPGNSYSWSPSTGLSSASISNPVASPSVTTTYTLTETIIATGCSFSKSVVVNVNPLPAAATGSDQTNCAGQSVTIGKPGVPGNTYSWSPALGLSSATLSNPLASPGSTTTYTLTETITATGCSNSASVVVNVMPLPAAVVGPDQALCDGSNVIIGANGILGNSYSWSPSTGLSSSTVSNPMVTPTVTETYTLTETDATTGCVNSNSVIITVNPLPTAVTGADQIICAGQGVNIGDVSIAGNTYNWTPSAGLSSDLVSNPLANPANTTTYTLTETITATGCSKSNQVKVTVNPLPLADVGLDKIICNGETASIGGSAIAGNTYSWAPSTGLNDPSVSDPSATPTVTTTYTLTETINTTGCSKSNSVIVTVNPLPLASTTADQTFCLGGSANIGAASVAGNTYSWSPSAGLSSAGISDPVATPSVTTTYILTETVTATGCTKSNQLVFNINPLPIAETGPDQVLCLGNNVTIGGSNVAGNTYSWSPSTDLSSSTASNPVATPTTSSTYTLTETITATGCTNSNSVVLTVNPLPAALVGPAQTICQGQGIGIGGLNVAGNSYDWTPSLGLSSNVVSDPVATPLNTTTYVLTETISATGCFKTDSVLVTVNSLPAANTGGNMSICFGQNINIGSSAVAGNTYSWTPVSDLSSATNANPTANPTTTTTYYLTETITATGCSKADSMVLKVNPLPATSAGADLPICFGQSATIGEAAIIGNNYNWSPSIGLNSATLSNPVAGPTATTTYVLTETVASTGCSNTDSVLVSVIPIPDANTGSNQTICFGQSTTIGNASIAGNTYMWSPALGLSSATVSNPLAQPVKSTTYTLTETNTLTGCSNSNFLVLLVTPEANAGSDQVICQGAGTSIGAAPAAGSTYNWSPSAGLSSSSAANPSANPSSTTTYVLTEVVTATGCTKSDSVIVTVNPLPAANTGPDTSVCFGQSVKIGATPVPGNTYFWTPGTLDSKIIANPTASPVVNTTYILVETTPAGCSKTDSVKVKINALPFANAGSDKIVCKGLTAQIGSNAISGFTYFWTPSTGLSNNSVSGPLADPLVSTTYILKVTDSIGCTKNDTVIVSPFKVNTLKTITNPLCNSDSNGVIKLFLINGDTTGYKYSWSTGDTTMTAESVKAGTYTVSISDVNCTYIDTVVVTEPPPLQASLNSDKTILGYNISQYSAHDGTINLTVNGGTQPYSYQWSNGFTSKNIEKIGAGNYAVVITDKNGCSLESKIELTEPSDLRMPTGFSPNADGKNDHFVIKGIDAYPINSLIIYNVVGSVVYKKSNYKNEWDGKDDAGTDLPDGTYFAVISTPGGKNLSTYVELKR